MSQLDEDIADLRHTIEWLAGHNEEEHCYTNDVPAFSLKRVLDELERLRKIEAVLLN